MLRLRHPSRYNGTCWGFLVVWRSPLDTCSSRVGGGVNGNTAKSPAMRSCVILFWCLLSCCLCSTHREVFPHFRGALQALQARPFVRVASPPHELINPHSGGDRPLSTRTLRTPHWWRSPTRPHARLLQIAGFSLSLASTRPPSSGGRYLTEVTRRSGGLPVNPAVT